MSGPAWMDDSGKAARQRQNKRSARQERSIAKSEGGRVQPGSGSSPRARGDVKTAELLIEVKYTDKFSYSIHKGVWNEHVRRARVQGKEPVMIIDFEPNGPRIRITEG